MIQSIQTKYSFLLTFAAVIGLFLFSSCSDSGTGIEEPEPEVESNTIESLEALGENGQYTFFSLRTGQIVSRSDSASTNWDLAFNGTTILTNSDISGPGSGGAIILDSSFSGVTIAPSEGYNTDTNELLAIPTGSGNGWYNYNFTTHKITPLPDKTIVIRTADGNHYAKLQIISYYKDNPDLANEEYQNNSEAYPSRYYTFDYVIQLEEGLRELE